MEGDTGTRFVHLDVQHDNPWPGNLATSNTNLTVCCNGYVLHDVQLSERA